MLRRGDPRNIIYIIGWRKIEFIGWFEIACALDRTVLLVIVLHVYGSGRLFTLVHSTSLRTLIVYYRGILRCFKIVRCSTLHSLILTIVIIIPAAVSTRINLRLLDCPLLYLGFQALSNLLTRVLTLIILVALLRNILLNHSTASIALLIFTNASDSSVVRNLRTVHLLLLISRK